MAACSLGSASRSIRVTSRHWSIYLSFRLGANRTGGRCILSRRSLGVDIPQKRLWTIVFTKINVFVDEWN